MARLQQRTRMEEEEMLPEEIAGRTAALYALMERGRISGPMITRKQEDIARIMSPLPPPWEWEQLRQQAGLTSIDMSLKSGIPANRIRYWECGHGTSYPDKWMEYAVIIAGITGERLRMTTETRTGTGTGNEAVIAHLEAMRAASNGLEMWLEQDRLPCTLQDVDVLWNGVRLALRSLRKSEKVLRQQSQVGHRGIGRNEQDAT